jgi:2-octaprenylphenol hydroxylase
VGKVVSVSKKLLPDFDIVIVGGGIAGTALAAALANTTLRIALLEANSIAEPKTSSDCDVHQFDSRVSALTESSRQLFEHLGVWDAIIRQRASAYKKMSVWDAEGTGAINFDCREINASWLGHIVENRVIVAALLQKVQQSRSITLQQNVRVKQLALDGEFPLITLQDDSQISARLIVAADGANSFLRDAAGFKTRQWEYDHKAIVCTVETESPHQHTAWQRFLAEGPLAFLPLDAAPSNSDQNHHFSSIVWSTSPAIADHLMTLNDEDFCQQLERAFESRLGKILTVGKRQCFPLTQRHATEYCQPGIVLIADAAHTVHPLAGQGINLGLKDVQILAEEIIRATERDLPIGDMAVLSRYQRRRKTNNLATMAAMESFKQLFARRELPVRWLRNSGMRWLNQMPLIKRAMIRQAMDI